MCDLISRQAAIEAADNWDGGCSPSRANMIKDSIRALPSAEPEERTAKALYRELDVAVSMNEGGITFTYDKGTSILHECESCGTFVIPSQKYCHECGVRLEWE